MSELITKQQAIDALTEYGNGRTVYISVEEAVRRIEQLPSAEPQIIRCKDCAKEHWCKFTQYQYQGENGFCSLAERRTDG